MTQTRKIYEKEVKESIASIIMPCLQEGYNPIHPMKEPITLKIEIREPKVIYSLLPAQMSNLHCEYSLSSSDMLSRYGIVSSLQDFSSLFVRWAFICQYHEVILQLASFCLLQARDFNKSWACGIKLTWKPFFSLVLQCFEPPGPTATFLRGACMILHIALLLYSRLS